MFTKRLVSRLTALLAWAASLGWTSAVTCCNIYREYHAPTCSFLVSTLSYVHRCCLSHHSNIRSYEMQPHPILVLYGWQFLLSCVVFCLTCDNIIHSLPLLLCGLYSIRAQNGYGQHRSCKIVLLTPVTPRGVNDPCLPWGKNIEHARTVYLSINNHIVDVIQKHQAQIKHSTSTPNAGVWRITRPAKFSSNHPSVVLTADVFSFSYKWTQQSAAWNIWLKWQQRNGCFWSRQSHRCSRLKIDYSRRRPGTGLSVSSTCKRSEFIIG